MNKLTPRLRLRALARDSVALPPSASSDRTQLSFFGSQSHMLVHRKELPRPLRIDGKIVAISFRSAAASLLHGGRCYERAPITRAPPAPRRPPSCCISSSSSVLQLLRHLHPIRRCRRCSKPAARYLSDSILWCRRAGDAAALHHRLIRPDLSGAPGALIKEKCDLRAKAQSNLAGLLS